jgi:membrane protein implicated in regulation of membrane protease activity
MVQSLHYLIVFVSGAVLMGLEIAGSRVLAPHFGSSIFVWGSLISVVMAALSAGYYWGGWRPFNRLTVDPRHIDILSAVPVPAGQ